MIDYGDKEPLEVDLDAREQLGKWRYIEILVVLESELAGMEVDLDEIGLTGIREPLQHATASPTHPFFVSIGRTVGDNGRYLGRKSRGTQGNEITR